MFLVCQAKPEKSGWLRSQPDKVSRPSEPSFAFIWVPVWMKRKQGDSRPQSIRVKVFSLENAYGVEQAQVIKNTEGSNAAIVKGKMADTPPGS
jgi:hypothetical protein